MRQFDVLIIGGGLIGCASAYYLAQRGAKVLLAEKNDINSLASGQNAGSLHFQLEHRLIEHGDTLSEQFSQIIPLNQLAANLWGNLEDELSEQMEVSMKGGLMAAMTDEEVALLKKKHALEQSHGLETQLITAKEALDIAPYLNSDIQAAAYFPKEGHANPRLVTPAFARAAIRNGATIESQCEVTLLVSKKNGWSAELKTVDNPQTESIHASMVLNAAGAWAAHSALLANIHLPVFPVPLMMNVTEGTSLFLPHLLQRAGAKLSMKQVAAGNILIGGGWASRFCKKNGKPDLTQRPTLIQENIRQNLSLAAELVPQVGPLNLLRCWTGIVGITSDQLPLLGAVPNFPGYYVATGGSGFTLGPVYATLISELMMAGKTSHDISLYSPGRFGHINNFMAEG